MGIQVFDHTTILGNDDRNFALHELIEIICGGAQRFAAVYAS